jgi:hypothetical protein
MIDDADLDELLNAVTRMRAVDRRLHRLQSRHELTMRGFLVATAPRPRTVEAVPEQDLAEPPA